MMSHKLHCTKSWGGTGPRELVLSAMEQATMNASGITGEGITVYRTQTTTSGQHVCFHNANNKKKGIIRNTPERRKKGRPGRRVDTRKGWFGFRCAMLGGLVAATAAQPNMFDLPGHNRRHSVHSHGRWILMSVCIHSWKATSNEI